MEIKRVWAVYWSAVGGTQSAVVSAASAALRTALSKLEKAQEKGVAMENGWEKAVYYRDKVLPAMEALRTPADTLEVLLGKEFWPMPTYTDLMFGIL